MTYWEIKEPEGSDYKHVHVSGKLDHPYRLPTAQCEKCGQSVCSLDVVLPNECPARFRENRLLTNVESDVSIKEFNKLTKDLAVELQRSGTKIPKLLPGACLQPGFLDVPSIPSADFLWSNLWSGLSFIVVSERVRASLEKLPTRDIAFYPVTFRQVDKRSAKSPPRISASGEPEDVMKEIGVANKIYSIGPYYQLLVLAESDYPPGAEPRSVCSACGEETDPDWEAKDTAWDNLTAEVLVSISKGYHIFKIPGRGAVYVTEAFKNLLEHLGATNVGFKLFRAPKVPVRRKRGNGVQRRK
ncbi:MAG TPA: hypothetical protein VEC99_10720 [Clostridia bacterium]|nr:hypothetical protein [Clostridia bacterium]